MNVYLDASVVLRRLQRKPAALVRWGQWQRAYSSALLRVEVLRAIDRNRIRGSLTDRDVSELLQNASAIFEAVEFVALTLSVLNRAAQSFLTPLGTLDALHLATALRLVEAERIDLVLLTHDTELAIAARGVNIPVEGV